MYEERYCLFVDILGFQSHIEDTVKNDENSKKAMTFNRLLSALKSISSEVHYKEKLISENGRSVLSSRMVTQFSDSVIISYKKNEIVNGAGISSMLMDVHRLQLELVNKGILLRGAITSGLLYHDSKFVFGPALNDAVTLEKLANYPRVILDGEILDEAGLSKKQKNTGIEYSRTISSMVSEDFDGLYFVDYFNIHPDDFNEEWGDMSYYLEKLRGLIKGVANKKSLSIKVKHSWLRTKFNLMAKPFMKSKFQKIGVHHIPEDDVQLFLGIKPF